MLNLSLKLQEKNSKFQQGASMIEVMVALMLFASIMLIMGRVLLQHRNLEQKLQHSFETTLTEWSQFERKQN